MKFFRSGIIWLLAISMALPLFYVPTQAYAGAPSPSISADVSSFSIDKGATRKVTFTVSNYGTEAQPFYIDVSMSGGLDVTSSSSSNSDGNWDRIPTNSKIYHSGSNTNDWYSYNLLYSYEGTYFSGWPQTRYYYLTFTGTQTGSQWIKYRASFNRYENRNNATNVPDTYVRNPSSGTIDQQSWNVYVINVTVKSPFTPTKIYDTGFSPTSFQQTNYIDVASTTGLDVGDPGTLQVSLGGVTNSKYVSGFQCIQVSINLSGVNVSSYSPGQRSMAATVMFRPNVSGASDIFSYPTYYFTVTAPPVQYYKASSPNPSNNSTGISRSPTVSWSANGNPSGTNYKVYTGTSSGNLSYLSQTSSTSFGVSGLSYGTTYYWRVDTVRTDGGIITGDVWNFTTINTQPPIANAGADQQVSEGATVALDGSSSYDPDGSIVTYSWKEGNNTLSNSKSFSQSYSVGIHTITLYVKDNDGNERSDSVVITVLKITTINSVSFSPSSFEKTNSINVTVNVGLDVGLGGYLQVQLGSVQSGMYVSGSQCTIKTLVLNNVDVSAYDLGSRSMTSYVQFRPGATSGPLTNSLAGDIVASPAYMFQVVPKYSKVTDPHPTNNQQDISLSPTLSWLPNGNPAGTKYRIYFGLSTTNLDLKREDTNTVYGITNLNYDTQYFWRIDTVQSDGYTAITGDSWNFKTVKNQDPIAVAGPDQTVEVGATVTLDASASHDPEGSPLTYRWYEHGDVFSNDKVAHTIFSEPGDHIITLDVLDPEGNEGMDVLTISVIKYSLEVTKYEDDFHNDIYGAFAKTAPYNDYEYDITTMVKIGLKNTGSVKDSYTASSNTNQNIRLDIFDPIWGLGAAEHTSTPQNSVTFSLNPGEEKELAIRIMTPPGTAVGSIINIPITISSATKPNLKIETNVAYEVLDTLDMDMYTINTLFKKLVFNYDVAFDNNAPIGSRAFEFAMAGITIIPIAGEGKLLFKAATVTGEEAVARELTVDELRSMAAETGVKGALGRVALTEAERALVKEIIVREMGEDSAKVFLEKLAGKGFEEEYLRALYELKDVEGFDNFLREAVSNGIGQETALSNFYHVARSARGWMVSSEVEKIALEKEFRVVINGAEVVSKPDIFVTFKNGKSAFVECKDIEIVSSDLGTVEKFKPAQYSRYNQVINSGQIAGVNSENTEIVYQIRGFAEGVTEQQQQQIISEIAAKLQGQYVDKRIIGTGLIIPAYISYKAVNDNNQQLQVSPNHAPGTYHSSVNMTFVEKNNRSVDVYYTLDGTDPGFFSAKYDSAWPVIINKSINVKYFAVDKETNAKTPIQTATYTIDNSQSKKIKVYDGTKLLDGLMVLLEKNGVNYFMNSSEAGVWSIPDVTPGQYNLTIKKIGYQDFTTTINPADSQNFTFTLQKEVTATPKFKWRLKI